MAISECAQDKLCEKVYDFLCDFKGQFYFCYKGSPEFFSDKRHISMREKNKKVSSCLYVKDAYKG